MNRISRRLAVLLAVVLVVVGAAAGASAATALHFGFKKVRSGLPSGIAHFQLTSTDVRAGRPIPARFWGCDDAGLSPQLSWRGAPAGTKSFAVQLFDPDAPTGSGFWHWTAWDLPASTTSLPTAAVLPAGAVNGRNDGGGVGYTGPCPPAGDITHHYVFTVVALSVPSLELPADTSAAVVGFVVGHNALGSATFTATAQQ
ncbi:YbhB/YbcL family Raf kinase inhibitor-like protein [Paractinoplanes ferrugineus]|uniref:Kinase inhibitor n=1 Tax=Paractinoplanes ferrugineus TaxID=113564 RepID=A0A919J7P6_9ACTN|nr:YbhB/YbcL family Raf kinase inhibitor-like protein [Actinoplanes ferrugineus]GIE15335.1 kinase inhibitor [Actinoplanes ferrugineus]